uniref:SNF2 N-terminal domain-containing protein n=1 Tax=Glossina austeni TaxID=7395 RepID=A0A1A9UDT0_GLOAU
MGASCLEFELGNTGLIVRNHKSQTSVATLMLRRTKAQLQGTGEVSNLPQKRTELIEIDLDKDEMKVYQRVMPYSHDVFAKFLKQKAESYEILALLLFAGLIVATFLWLVTIKYLRSRNLEPDIEIK